MLVNLPAAANGGNGDSRLTAMDAVEGQCEYNFLKRKLATVEHGIPNLLINSHNDGVADAYQGASTAMWKKRHIKPNASGADDANCYDVHAYAASSLHDFNGSTGVVGDNINSSSSGGGCHVPTSASSGSGANSNDLTFNLIGSSSFINDLFAYDANLIVPVSASLISSSGGSASLSLCSPSALPTYTTPTSVCVNAAYDDDAHWQATDLLELDHRYNSGLQTEIAQLQPTVTLKSIGEQLPQHGTQIDQQQQQQSTEQTQNYLVPEKQVSRSSTAQHSQPKVRQQQQPQQQQQRQQQQQQQQQQHLPQADNPTAAMDTETDFEDKNLSWLLNFKFDELPHLSPDVGANQLNSASAACGGLSHSTSPTYSNKSNNSSPHSTSYASNTPTQMPPTENSRSPKSSTKAGRKFEELVMEVTAELDGSDMIVAENVVIEDTIMKAPKKPPFTYTELIEYALEDKGELTVSGIYQWISDRFPYYKSNDDRWKNSVRHNLSINPHFRKGVKAPQGAGHLWTISSGDSAENVLAWEHKKQRLDLFFKMESMNRERLQQHQQQLQLQHHCTSPHQDCQQQQQQQQQQRQCSYDEADAAAAALISQEMLQHASDSACDAPHCGISNGHRLEPSHAVHELPFNDLMSDEELRKTAGQILNGIHREVEVQSVNSIISTYHDVLLENEDYLNPVHKDVAVNESGLRNTTTTHLSPHAHAAHAQPPSHSSSQYYVTEIDPLELGIQMSHQVEAEEVLFSDEFNLNYFGYNAGTDIVA